MKELLLICICESKAEHYRPAYLTPPRIKDETNDMKQFFSFPQTRRDRFVLDVQIIPFDSKYYETLSEL
jgi:hypothetical protein